MDKVFIKYLIASFIAHIIIAFCLYFTAGFAMFAGLGNASDGFIKTINLILLALLVIFLLVEIFLLTRKNLSIKKRIVVSALPLLIGLFLLFGIEPVGTKLMSLSESFKTNQTKNSVKFAGTFMFTESENTPKSHHTVSVPFVANSNFGTNTFIFAYKISTSQLPLDKNGDNSSECSFSNKKFNAIVDSQGNIYALVASYGDGEMLPAGTYQALKYVSVNTTIDNETYCYNKVIEDIKTSKKIDLYTTNISAENSTNLLQSLTLVEQ